LKRKEKHYFQLASLTFTESFLIMKMTLFGKISSIHDLENGNSRKSRDQR